MDSTNIIVQNKYEKRIIAYADILGWRQALNTLEFKIPYEVSTSIENHANNFSIDLKKVIEDAQGVSSEFKAQHSSIEFSFFSDSFAISAPISYGKKIFEILAWSSDNLLRKGFLLRGGVTIGDLCHRRGLIFGPALVKAVEIEENDAMYPRFICSNKLVAHLDNVDYKNEVVLEDFPQSWVVNIACGTLIARDELMDIVQKKLCEMSKSDKLERIIRKWRYIQEMLPKMYELKIKAI